jgi:general secretion pathway protein A
MYHAHFALAEEPFGISPDGRFFYETEQHREALATLYYGIQQRRGFGALIGHAGLGKTSVLFRLREVLRNQAETAYLPHPYFDRETLLEAVMFSFGLSPLPSVAQNYWLFHQYLLEVHASGKTCVVIFDEAQAFNADTLEGIRLLSNFETGSEKLVQIVLSGQPGLAETLAQSKCEQLRQRVNVVARLEPLSDIEVSLYMAHRLATAGCSASIFASEAVRTIASASGGVPRNVNTICFNALTLAYAVGRPRVGKDEVAEVLQDLDLDCDLPAYQIDDLPVPVATVEDPKDRTKAAGGAFRLQELTTSFRHAVFGAVLVLVAAGRLS